MDEAFRKARELGEIMLASPLYEKLEQARNAFDEDMEAREALFDYNAKHRRVEALMSNGDENMELKEANEELREAADRLENDEIIKELITCETRFNNYMTQVMNIIKATVTGDTAEGCTGNCSGCSGCH
ncbi:MAG: YlbF family regulator [Clostridiales bacterium]|nr:YlbF family regulator [Clostridiales bacterium]